MTNTEYRASKKRLVLSWYIDLIFFMVLWELISYYLSLDAAFPFWAPYLIFLIIRAVSGRYIGSIGFHVLGIEKESNRVDPNILERESWLTILLGVLLILEGSKLLVRWTQVLVSQPLFGFFPTESTQILIQVVLGASFIISGYWFLKLNVKGFYLAISVLILNIASDIASWELWDPVVEKMVLARREVQGMPVRDGEVEFVQSIFPEGVVIAAVIAVVAMLFTYKRFRRI